MNIHITQYDSGGTLREDYIIPNERLEARGHPGISEIGLGAFTAVLTKDHGYVPGTGRLVIEATEEPLC